MKAHPILYLVSFADSKVYRLPYQEGTDIKTRLEALSGKLKVYLEKIYPDQPIAYFTSPKVEEIYTEADAKQYSVYPLLNASAFEAIERKLGNEVLDRESLNRLNSDAPFSDILNPNP